jgi:hypothetical protein
MSDAPMRTQLVSDYDFSVIRRFSLEENRSWRSR